MGKICDALHKRKQAAREKLPPIVKFTKEQLDEYMETTFRANVKAIAARLAKSTND